jgi:hypothetical protein
VRIFLNVPEIVWLLETFVRHSNLSHVSRLKSHFLVSLRGAGKINTNSFTCVFKHKAPSIFSMTYLLTHLRVCMFLCLKHQRKWRRERGSYLRPPCYSKHKRQLIPNPHTKKFISHTIFKLTRYISSSRKFPLSLTVFVLAHSSLYS